MSVNANWSISGIKLENSTNAFVTSAKIASSTKTLKKHQKELDKNFKQYIQDNMLRAGVDADNLQDVFSLNISSKGINFVNTEPLITQRYEYGYYEENSKDKNMNEDEYYEEYIIQTSPKYFIRPSVQQSLKDVGKVMLEEAKKEYNNHHGNEVYEEQKRTNIPNSTNYRK